MFGIGMAFGPLVSAIVVNWNGARDLETCLPTLLCQSYRPLEITVVDNASTDDSASVARRFGVRWLPLDQNLGLAPALNRGAEAARGELLLFLNNDMRFHEEFVASMVSEMLKRNDVLAVDALQYDWDGAIEVHLATRLATKNCEGSRCHELTPGLHMCQEQHDTPTAVLMASAANMLARKSMFQQLGGFDEKLFFGYEDVDLCWRGWMHGWNTIFVPAAKCWHRVSHSTYSTSARSLSFRGIETGRLVMATKLLPVKYALITWFVSLAGLARDLGLLRWQRAADRIRVLRECLRYFRPLVRERRRVHRSAQTSPALELERLLRLRPAEFV
jgi:GT2 family glycosyltransferase